MSGSRDRILGRIREALAWPAPRHYEAELPRANAAVTTSFAKGAFSERTSQQWAIHPPLRRNARAVGDDKISPRREEIARRAEERDGVSWQYTAIIDERLAGLRLFYQDRGRNEKEDGKSARESDGVCVARRAKVRFASPSEPAAGLERVPPEHLVTRGARACADLRCSRALATNIAEGIELYLSSGTSRTATEVSGPRGAGQRK